MKTAVREKVKIRQNEGQYVQSLLLGSIFIVIGGLSILLGFIRKKDINRRYIEDFTFVVGPSRKIYKFQKIFNIGNHQIVSMILSNRKVAGCFNFSDNLGAKLEHKKVYKDLVLEYIRMFPSDPKGSLDDFFLKNIVVFGEVLANG